MASLIGTIVHYQYSSRDVDNHFAMVVAEEENTVLLWPLPTTEEADPPEQTIEGWQWPQLPESPLPSIPRDQCLTATIQRDKDCLVFQEGRTGKEYRPWDGKRKYYRFA